MYVPTTVPSLISVNKRSLRSVVVDNVVHLIPNRSRISPGYFILLVTNLHLPHSIIMRLHAYVVSIIIFTLEMTGSLHVEVLAVGRHACTPAHYDTRACYI